jgi:hypothetical protein
VTGKVLAEDLVCRANGARVTESGARLRQRLCVSTLWLWRGQRRLYSDVLVNQGLRSLSARPSKVALLEALKERLGTGWRRGIASACLAL